MPEKPGVMRLFLFSEVTKVTLGNIANVTAQTRYNTAFEVYGNMVTLKSIKRVTEKNFVGVYACSIYIIFYKR